MRPDLPNYKKPPVVEVALSVQFEQLTEMRTHHVGLLWAEYRKRFPNIEEHPLLEPVFETFLNTSSPRPRLTVRITESPEFPRCWFLNPEKTRLIQVQNDRFIYNWRKVEGDEEYPRYEDVRDNFLKELHIFTNFIGREKLGEVKPNHCDVTYVNSIPTEEGIFDHARIGKVIKTIAFNYGSEANIFNLNHEDARFYVRYLIPDSEGEPCGRLHISFEPLYRSKDGQPIFLLKLTARGTPDPDDINGVVNFLDSGREHIVNGFTAWTTKFMHEKWERIR